MLKQTSLLSIIRNLIVLCNRNLPFFIHIYLDVSIITCTMYLLCGIMSTETEYNAAVALFQSLFKEDVEALIAIDDVSPGNFS